MLQKQQRPYQTLKSVMFKLVIMARRLRIKIVLCFAFAISCSLSMTSASLASCAHKSALISSMVNRLVDYAKLGDQDQQMRDQEIIRSDAKKIADEDCLNSPAEIDRLASFAKTIAQNLDVAEDYWKKGIQSAPIPIVIGFSVDSKDTAECRCYARQKALGQIFADIDTLFITYASGQPMTPTERETRFIFAWLKVLDNDLYNVSNIHLRSLTSVSSGDISAALRIADAQLEKHCGYKIHETVAFPHGCLYTYY